TTAAEWLNAADPYALLRDFPLPRWDPRKLRLVGCACLRRAWPLLTDQRSRACVEMTERVEDGQATEEEACEVYRAFFDAAEEGLLADHPELDVYEAVRNLVVYVDPSATLEVAGLTADGVGHAAAHAIPAPDPDGWSEPRGVAWREAERRERAAQTDLIRCIFGNPFRPVRIEPGWLAWDNGAVRRLAQAIYDDRAFDRLPILA